MSLEKEFNLGENNPDPGGGILYCMRCDSEHIEEHHAQVIKALKNMSITFKDDEASGGIAVIPENELTPDEEKRELALLEELSVINEAREYKEVGLDDVTNVKELCERLTLSFYENLDQERLVDAYNFVSVFLPTVIRDLRIADKQNGVLSKKDMDAVQKLADFATAKEKMLNKNRILILGKR